MLSPELGRILSVSLGEKATPPMFTIVGRKLRAPPSWRKIGVLVRRQSLHLSEIEQNEERCLDAMLHWRNPAERRRTPRRLCHTHTLIDDNPTSG